MAPPSTGSQQVTSLAFLLEVFLLHTETKRQRRGRETRKKGEVPTRVFLTFCRSDFDDATRAA